MFKGLLRLQQIYQGLKPGNESFQVETVKRITNVSTAIDFLRTLEELNRWSKKYVVLDCPTDMAKEIVVSHVRDVTLGRRTYHYLLSGLVSINKYYTPIYIYILHKISNKKTYIQYNNVQSYVCMYVILFVVLWHPIFLISFSFR